VDIILCTFMLLLSLPVSLPIAVAIKRRMDAKKDGARRYVMENYSRERIVDRYEEFYSGMVAGSGFKL